MQSDGTPVFGIVSSEYPVIWFPESLASDLPIVNWTLGSNILSDQNARQMALCETLSLLMGDTAMLFLSDEDMVESVTVPLSSAPSEEWREKFDTLGYAVLCKAGDSVAARVSYREIFQHCWVYVRGFGSRTE